MILAFAKMLILERTYHEHQPIFTGSFKKCALLTIQKMQYNLHFEKVCQGIMKKGHYFICNVPTNYIFFA